MTEEKQGSELDKLKSKASTFGIDADKLMTEISVEMKKSVITELRPILDLLTEKISATITAVNSFKDTLPQQIAPVVEEIFKANASILTQQMGDQLKQRFQGAIPSNGGQNPVAAMGLPGNTLLSQLTVENIAKIIELFKPQPAPQQQLQAQMNLLFRGIVLGQRMKGIGPAADFARAIDETIGST